MNLHLRKIKNCVLSLLLWASAGFGAGAGGAGAGMPSLNFFDNKEIFCSLIEKFISKITMMLFHKNIFFEVLNDLINHMKALLLKS